MDMKWGWRTWPPTADGFSFFPGDVQFLKLPKNRCSGSTAQILRLGCPSKHKGSAHFFSHGSHGPNLSHELVVQAVILRLNKAFSEVIICFYFEPFLNVILGFMVNSCTFVRIHLVILLNRDFDKKSDCQDCGMEIFI